MTAWLTAAAVPVLLGALTIQAGAAAHLAAWLSLWRRRSLLLRKPAGIGARRSRSRAPGLFCDAALLLCAGFALSAALTLPAERLPAAAALASLLLMLILYDLRWLVLPDRLTAPLALAGVVDGALASQGLDAIGGAALAGGLFFTVHGLHRVATGREGLGLGDVKLAGALGAWVGLAGAAPMIVAATVLGLAWHLPALLRRQRPKEQPFGPALALAGWAVWLCRELGALPWPP